MKLRALILSALVIAPAVIVPIASSAPKAPPSTVTAAKLAASKPPFLATGRRVSASTLTNRVFVDHRNGFSLAFTRSATYGACTTTSGRVWRICSPELHVNAANAMNVVTEIGADHWTYWVYGGPGGGPSLVVSNDAGKTWYRAYMPGIPMAVVLSDVGIKRQLIAFVATGQTPLVYISSDGGRSWQHSNRL